MPFYYVFMMIGARDQFCIFQPHITYKINSYSMRYTWTEYLERFSTR